MKVWSTKGHVNDARSGAETKAYGPHTNTLPDCWQRCDPKNHEQSIHPARRAKNPKDLEDLELRKVHARLCAPQDVRSRKQQAGSCAVLTPCACDQTGARGAGLA